MGLALGRLAAEDPSFRVRTDEESGQTDHFAVWVNRTWISSSTVCVGSSMLKPSVGAPQVAYRECIKKAVEQEGKFVKQSGGRGQFGHVWLKIEPNEAGNGYALVDAYRGWRCAVRTYSGG